MLAKSVDIDLCEKFSRIDPVLRRFIVDVYAVGAPLTNLTKNDRNIQKWYSSGKEAFEALKKSITTAPLLVDPMWNKSFRGHVDASKFSVEGNVTHIDENGHDRVIAFF